MYFYKLEDKILISNTKYNLNSVSEDEAKDNNDLLFFLRHTPCISTRDSFVVTQPFDLFQKFEDISILNKNNSFFNIPKWIEDKINERKLICVNTCHPNWEYNIKNKVKQNKYKVHVVGLGDVGGTLIIGLRMLGKDIIDSIGIYDKDPNKIKRWDYECNQIISPDIQDIFPPVVPLCEEEIFDCDMFVFCVSIGVPPVGNEQKDVRLAQFEGNSKVVSYYSKIARQKNFKGIFAIVSDPVDLLCHSAFVSSNTNESGDFDFNGLSTNQIRGYGLGVMNARALYYSKQSKKTEHYIKEGRAFGPHGEGLIIADSITNFNEDLSDYLTLKTKKANMDVRNVGYKPYIAPALSSGAYSIISTLKGDWHYSCTFIGGIFMGSKNRYIHNCTELEIYNMPDALLKRLDNTYKILYSLCK